MAWESDANHIIMQPIGIPFIIMQQVLPGIIMPIMQSQQA
jgi:hypothetical protein